MSRRKKIQDESSQRGASVRGRRKKSKAPSKLREVPAQSPQNESRVRVNTTHSKVPPVNESKVRVDSIRKKLSSKKKKKGHSQEGIKNLQPVEKPGEVKRKFATKESLSTRVRHKKTNVNQIQTQNQNQDTAPPKEPATLRVKKTAEKKCQPIPEVKGKKDSDDIKEEQQSEKLEKTTADDIVNVNPNVDTPTPTPTSTPINNNPTTDIFQKNCLTWVQKIIKKRIVAIQNEFLVEKGYLPRKKCEVFVRNEKKNRTLTCDPIVLIERIAECQCSSFARFNAEAYGDVICTDSTRVILKNREPDDDYIHASWVQSPFPNSQKYICAQGPMTETVNDFWHMIFQEHVTVIVMLCNFDEMGFEKCAVYWPLEVGQTSNYEEYYVKNEKIETCEVENVKVTTLSVHAGRSKDEYLTIRHYQWPGWPDHMAPGDPAPCVTLLSMVKARSKNDPILVHCSAGIGRTGTFCGIDYTYDRIRIKPEIEMKQILRELRNQRIHSIQSAPQYIYLHVCVIHFLVTSNIVPNTPEIDRFNKDYFKYLQKQQQKKKKKGKKKSQQREADQPQPQQQQDANE